VLDIQVNQKLRWLSKCYSKVNSLIDAINASFYAIFKAKRLSIARYLSIF